jgi:uncharacterized glyoxalase superfamily protein PhnB
MQRLCSCGTQLGQPTDFTAATLVRTFTHAAAVIGRKRSRMARLSRIAPELPVADVAAAIEFYEQKLGFRAVMQMPDGEYAIVERDGVAIHLFQDTTRTRSPVGLHIFTEQLDELEAEFRGRGARLSQQIMRKPWGNRDFRVSDDWGNEIKFTEPSSGDT